MFTDEELQDIGEGFYNRGNYAYAPELFTERIAYYHLLGLAQLKTGRLNEAIDSFETVIRKDASYLHAYKDPAHAHEQNGDRKKAVICLKKARQLRYAQWHNNEVNRLLTLLDRS